MSVKSKFRAILITAVLFIPGFSAAEQKIDMEPVDVPNKMTETGWSRPDSGLLMRLRYPEAVSYIQPLEMYIDFIADSGVTIPDTALLRKLLTPSSVTLRMTNSMTGDLFEMPADEFEINRVAAADNNGNLNGVTIRAWFSLSGTVDQPYRIVDNHPWVSKYNFVWSKHESREFPLLTEGTYLGYVQVRIAEKNPVVPGRLFVANWFDLDIIGRDSVTREMTFRYPKKIKLGPGPCVTWDDDDLEEFTVTTHIDRYLEFSLRVDNCDFVQEGVPVFPCFNFGGRACLCDSLTELRFDLPERPAFVNGQWSITFNASLEERSLFRRDRCWVPGKCDTLWQREMTLTVDAGDYYAAVIPESELYDYQTVLIPDTIRIIEGGLIGYDPGDVSALEVRLQPGEKIYTEISLAGERIARKEGGPVPPLADISGKIASFEHPPLTVRVLKTRDSALNRFCFENPEDTVDIWRGEYELNIADNRFGIKNQEKYDQPPTFRRRRFLIPDSLYLNDDLELAFDSNFTLVELEKRDSAVVLIHLKAWESKSFFPSEFPNPIFMTIPGRKCFYPDELVCVLNLFEVVPHADGYGYEVVKSLWTKAYHIDLSEKQCRTFNKILPKYPKRDMFLDSPYR